MLAKVQIPEPCAGGAAESESRLRAGLTNIGPIL